MGFEAPCSISNVSPIYFNASHNKNTRSSLNPGYARKSSIYPRSSLCAMLLRTLIAVINFMEALSLPPIFRMYFKRTGNEERCVTRQTIKQPKRQRLTVKINERWKIRATVIRWWLLVRRLAKRLVTKSHRRDRKEMQWTGKARERFIAATISALLNINSICIERGHNKWVEVLNECGIATTIAILLEANRLGKWFQKKFWSLRISLKINVIAATITVLLHTKQTAQRCQKFQKGRMWLKMTAIAIAITILLGAHKITLQCQKFRLWRIWLKMAIIAAIITVLLMANDITQFGRKKFWSLRIGLKTSLITATINILLGTNRVAQWCQRKFWFWGILLETSAVSAIITILLATNLAIESVSSYGKSTSATISSYWFRVIEPWILARTISVLLAVQWTLSAVQQFFSPDPGTFLTTTGSTSAASGTARNATTTTTTTTTTSSSPFPPASAFFASATTALATKVSAIKDALARTPHLLPLYHKRRSKHQSMYSLYMVFITSHRLERSRSDRSTRLVDAAMYG
ncbi:hypothetical protein BDD12DRAFT_951174 [Trichophaea hybrida]|nr:hypothetical protein BDD12DRAFT_951174 [Trichophaea hybrida]